MLGSGKEMLGSALDMALSARRSLSIKTKRKHYVTGLILTQVTVAIQTFRANPTVL